MTLPREARIILPNQPQQSGAGRIDERMEALPVGASRAPVKMRFQQGSVGGRRGEVRRAPRRQLCSESPQVGLTFSACSLSRLLSKAWTTPAWLHVRGDTDNGAPVYGWICSGRQPLGWAWAAAQCSRSSVSARSASEVARLIFHSASQSVPMIHGLPGTRALSSDTCQYQLSS
jgi:hypothetical protein